MLTNDGVRQSYLVTHGNHFWNYGQTEGKKTFHPEQAQTTTCLKEVQYCIITMQWVLVEVLFFAHKFTTFCFGVGAKCADSSRHGHGSTDVWRQSKWKRSIPTWYRMGIWAWKYTHVKANFKELKVGEATTVILGNAWEPFLTHYTQTHMENHPRATGMSRSGPEEGHFSQQKLRKMTLILVGEEGGSTLTWNTGNA